MSFGLRPFGVAPFGLLDTPASNTTNPDNPTRTTLLEPSSGPRAPGRVPILPVARNVDPVPPTLTGEPNIPAGPFRGPFRIGAFNTVPKAYLEGVPVVRPTGNTPPVLLRNFGPIGIGTAFQVKKAYVEPRPPVTPTGNTYPPGGPFRGPFAIGEFATVAKARERGVPVVTPTGFAPPVLLRRFGPIGIGTGFAQAKAYESPVVVGGAVTGSLDATIDPFTLSGSGTIDLIGAATPLIDPFSLAGIGAIALTGLSTPTIDAFTLVGAGVVAISGSATPTIDPFTLAGVGAIPLTGTATPTIAPFTLAGVGSVAIVGTATITIPAFTLAGVGTVANTGITGTLNATIGAFTLSGAGAVALTGVGTPVISPFTLSGSGFIPGPRSGGLSVSFDPFVLEAYGTVTGVVLTDIVVRISRNYLLPPPRFTGKIDTDLRALFDWCNQLHNQLVVADNALGTLRAMISQTRLQVGDQTNVAEQFARMIEKIDQMAAQILALEAR